MRPTTDDETTPDPGPAIDVRGLRKHYPRTPRTAPG